MKNIKTFEGFKDWFKSKEQKAREEMFGTKDLSNGSEEYNTVDKSEIMIESEPYENSQFGQEKYGVYIELPDGVRYYIGDIRKFINTDGQNPYISYLNLDKITKKEPLKVLVRPNKEQMDIINNELDRNYLSRNLMDDTITYREKIKNELNIEL
jgi:hypothetical protein